MSDNVTIDTIGPVDHTTRSSVDVADIYYRESMVDLVSVFGNEVRRRLRETALLLFTPDAIVSRQVTAGLRLVEQAGFTPVAAALVRLTRHVHRDVWRRELFEMSLDRVAAGERLLGFTDSIAVLLVERGRGSALAASERLTTLKGRGEPRYRAQGTLRASLDSPNSLFRLIHTADRPGELVRELGILFPPEERLRLLRDVRRCRPLPGARLEELAGRARSPVGEHRLDTAEPLRRAAALVEVAVRATPADRVRRAFQRQLAALSAGRPVSSRRLCDTALAAGLPLDPWDVVALSALAVCVQEAAGLAAADGRAG